MNQSIECGFCDYDESDGTLIKRCKSCEKKMKSELARLKARLANDPVKKQMYDVLKEFLKGRESWKMFRDKGVQALAAYEAENKKEGV